MSDEAEMFGGIKVDELEEMSKTHPRAALSLAYGQGLIVGINRAKAKFKYEKSLNEIQEITSNEYYQKTKISDAEIQKIALQAENWTGGFNNNTFNWMKFARAIESAHGIK